MAERKLRAVPTAAMLSAGILIYRLYASTVLTRFSPT
jgi:hypothetical protein